MQSLTFLSITKVRADAACVLVWPVQMLTNVVRQSSVKMPCNMSMQVTPFPIVILQEAAYDLTFAWAAAAAEPSTQELSAERAARDAYRMGRAFAADPVLHPLETSGAPSPSKSAGCSPACFPSCASRALRGHGIGALAQFDVRMSTLKCDALCSLLLAQARSLTVVLREPSHEVVPLATAAALPADALGRCALTTQSVAEMFKGTLPWHERSKDGTAVVWAWLNEAFPQHDAPFNDIAELDGAAAMRAAVPSDATAWLELQKAAKGQS
jgi:hypothetical protein